MLPWRWLWAGLWKWLRRCSRGFTPLHPPPCPAARMWSSAAAWRHTRPRQTVKRVSERAFAPPCWQRPHRWSARSRKRRTCDSRQIQRSPLPASAEAQGSLLSWVSYRKERPAEKRAYRQDWCTSTSAVGMIRISCIRVCCSDGTRRASARSSCPSRVQRTEVRKNTCIMLFEGILQRFWDFWMTAMQVDTSTSAALPPLWPRMLPMSWLICWATWLDWTWLRQSAKGCQAIRARFFPTTFFRHKGDKGDASTGFTKLTDLQEKGRVIFDVWGWTERSAHDSSPRSKTAGKAPAACCCSPHVSA